LARKSSEEGRGEEVRHWVRGTDQNSKALAWFVTEDSAAEAHSDEGDG
ncbi:hypothetical protein TrRE_jg11692, partial [Triparma retinervis]